MIKSRIKQERDVTEFVASIGSSEFKIRFPQMGARSAHALFNVLNELIVAVQKQERMDMGNTIASSILPDYEPKQLPPDNIVRTLVLTPHIDVEPDICVQPIQIKAGTYRAFVSDGKWQSLECLKEDTEILGTILCDGIVRSNDDHHYFVG